MMIRQEEPGHVSHVSATSRRVELEDVSVAGEPLREALALLPIIGILRDCPLGLAGTVAESAYVEGLRTIEVTLDSDLALQQIEAIANSDNPIAIGAGTVTRPHDAKAAVDAGAQFIVTPTTSLDVIEACRSLGVPVIPGAATPTEILTAWRAGAFAVKVFPIGHLGGPAYLRAVAPTVGRPALVPTGGVTLENAREYLDSGAIAVAAGSELFPPRMLKSSLMAEISSRVGRWVAAI